MRFPSYSKLENKLDAKTRLSVFGANIVDTPAGKVIHRNPEGFWGKITGVLSCSTSVNPSSLTDTAALCCTKTGELTAPYTAYTFIRVQEDSCGRWKNETQTGICYEANDNYVSLNAIVWLRKGFSDDYRFDLGAAGFSSAQNIPTKCVELPISFDCDKDTHGNPTGRTIITYEKFAVIDAPCGSSGTSGG